MPLTSIHAVDILSFYRPGPLGRHLGAPMHRRGLLARLSKPKSTTHDFAQAIRKRILKQKTSYPNS